METEPKNTLEKSQKYLDLILELFKKGSLTARLDSQSLKYDSTDAKICKVLTVKTTGLGNYQKDKGYPQGAITAEWLPFELTVDRGAKFLLDRIDDDEILGLTIGGVARNFTDYKMIPELDAYRFAKYCDGAGETVTGTLTDKTILDAIDLASTHMNGLDVPENRILYVNQDLELLLRKALNRVWANDSNINTRITNYNGMEIVYAPNKRFQTVIELLSGENDQWGYKAGTGSSDINFLLMELRCVVQASKTAKGKFISADNNPDVDSHLYAFRVFHDAFVIDALKDGVYAHVKG